MASCFFKDGKYNEFKKGETMKKALELVKDPNIKEKWKKRKQKLWNDNIDLTLFMVWYIENFPDSFIEMKEDSDIEYRFRNIILK